MSIINTVSLVNDRKDHELPKAKCITHVYETRFESWLWWGGRLVVEGYAFLVRKLQLASITWIVD